MKQTVMVKPGLIVDLEMHQHVCQILHAKAPDLTLPTWEEFKDPTKWFLVPDPRGRGYKAEYVVECTPKRTININRWMYPDRRDGRKPKPHSHPRKEFEVHVAMGGYTEDRYTVEREADGSVVEIIKETVTHRAGDVSTVSGDLFHEVIEVLPDTTTVTLCGPGIEGDWGYINPDTGVYTQAQPDPDFKARAAALNPELQQ